MSFYVITTMLFGFGFVICCILLYVNKQEYLKNIGNKEITIVRLNRKSNILEQIIKNNEYDMNKDYNNIMFISSEKRIVLSNGRITCKKQYTKDVKKAKNFAKHMNDYIEIEEDGE